MRFLTRQSQLLCCLVAVYGSMFEMRPALGKQVDTLIVAGNHVAEFGRAVSISVAGDGRVFVVDADRNSLVVLRQDGAVDEIVGGVGTDEGQFDQPADVDPSNGLVIYVADTGNGRVQKFSRAFRFLESLPVSSGVGQSSSDLDPSFRTGASATRQSTDGLPTSVITSPLEDLYAVESVSATVIRWDRERRNRWIIGNDEAGEHELLAPVDLAVTGDYLYVADSLHQAILVYDLFGAPVRAVARGILNSIRAVKAKPGMLLAVLKRQIVEFTPEGRLLKTYSFELFEDLVDADYYDGHFYLLTDRHLYRVTE